MDANETKYFYQGFACALSTLIRFHDLPTVALDLMTCNGITVEKLREAGTEAYDLDPIIKAARQEWRKS